MTFTEERAEREQKRLAIWHTCRALARDWPADGRKVVDTRQVRLTYTRRAWWGKVRKITVQVDTSEMWLAVNVSVFEGPVHALNRIAFYDLWLDECQPAEMVAHFVKNLRKAVP